ncbi:MAG: hypothetical protein KJ630_07025 [Proteobacteria bacterium]|nr:hypothetical protein [Pseudomonadota bacterium]
MSFNPIEPSNKPVDILNSLLEEFSDPIRNLLLEVLGDSEFLFRDEAEFREWEETAFECTTESELPPLTSMANYEEPIALFELLIPVIRASYWSHLEAPGVFLAELTALLFRVDQRTISILGAWKHVVFEANPPDHNVPQMTVQSRSPHWIKRLFESMAEYGIPNSLAEYFSHKSHQEYLSDSQLFVFNEGHLALTGRPLDVYQFLNKEYLLGRIPPSGSWYDDPTLMEFWFRHSPIFDRTSGNDYSPLPFHSGLILHKNKLTENVRVLTFSWLINNILEGAIKNEQLHHGYSYLGQVCLSVLNKIDHATHDFWSGNSHGWNIVSKFSVTLHKWFEVFIARIKEGEPDHAIFASAWHISVILLDGDDLERQSISEETLNLLRNLAYSDWGQFRKNIGDEAFQAKFIDPGLESGQNRIFVQRDARNFSAIFISKLEGVWPAMKLILLALRVMPVRTCAADLRYWDDTSLETQFPLPKPWHFIPFRFMWFIHHMQLDEDPHAQLLAVRENFASYLLERLKTTSRKNATLSERPIHEVGTLNTIPEPLDQNDAFIEKSPIWRYFYIRALRELEVNPGGRGHRVLQWLSGNDPNELVRKAAKIAATELKHRKSGTNRSPRRMLLAAFWWIRQGHMYYLRDECHVQEAIVDEKGAQRTRQQEVRYAKD